MAVYRIICMKRPDIAMNIKSQRRITNRCLVWNVNITSRGWVESEIGNLDFEEKENISFV